MNMIRQEQQPAALPVVLDGSGRVSAVVVSGRQLTPDRIVNWEQLRNVAQTPPPPKFRLTITAVVPDLRPYKEGGDLYSPGGGVQCLSAKVYSAARHAAGVQIIDKRIEEVVIEGNPGKRVTCWAEIATPGRLPVQESASCEMSYEDAYDRFGKHDRDTGAVIEDAKGKARIRTNVVRVLETWAERNVTRKLLELPAGYKDIGALQGKVLAFARVDWDANDPAVMAELMRNGMHAGKRLFSGPRVDAAEPTNLGAGDDPELAAAMAEATDAETSDAADPLASAPLATAATNPAGTAGRSAGKGSAPDNLPGQPSLPTWWRWEDADKAAQFSSAADEIHLANVIAELDTPDALGKVARAAFTEYSSKTDFGDPANVTKPMQSAAYHFALARIELWRRAQK